jgi:hypothetical protein
MKRLSGAITLKLKLDTVELRETVLIAFHRDMWTF